jgi:hypothetical protein
MFGVIKMIWQIWMSQTDQKELEKELENPLLKYNFLHFSKKENEKFLNYIYSKIQKISKLEKIQIFYITPEELNENNSKPQKAGCFIFYNGDYNKCQERISYLKTHYSCLFLKDEERKFTFPRIEIDNTLDLESQIFVTIHELGHYFMYKNEEKQSELKADLYILDFFDTYLPPYFKWLFQILLNLYGKKDTINWKGDLEFTKYENFQYWKECQIFLQR